MLLLGVIALLASFQEFQNDQGVYVSGLSILYEVKVSDELKKDIAIEARMLGTKGAVKVSDIKFTSERMEKLLRKHKVRGGYITTTYKVEKGVALYITFRIASVPEIASL